MTIALVPGSSYFDRVFAFIRENHPEKETLLKFKNALAKELGVKRVPTDIDILMHAPEDQITELKPYLITKPVRTRSGVSVVAVMTEPRKCPHGKCTFCPGGPGSVFGDTPQSYTGHEPSTMRGRRNDWDSYRIVFNRLEHYVATGHYPDKCDVIIMGGTFPSYDYPYQERFVKGIFAALNDFSTTFFPDGKLDLVGFKSFFMLPGRVDDPSRAEVITERILALKEKSMQKTLAQLMQDNEESVCRCIGLTQETKPDWGLLDHGNAMLALGTTRVELGIQALRDDVLKNTHRGHTLQDTKDSFAILRDLGFKINAHCMLGLPGMSVDDDKQSLRDMFTLSDYRPDMVKIYPTLVMKGTALYYQWKQGQYTPLRMEDCVETIAEFFRDVPRYCRVMRVQRDIPSTVSDAGVTKTNLRQDVDAYMQQHSIASQDIRAREIGDTLITEPQLVVTEYEASGGKEFFIAIEDKPTDKLIGFVRMRFPPRSLRKEITLDSALIRELHVYGSAVAIGASGTTQDGQHRGFGKQLMAKAEELARAQGKNKMLVISGIGVRQYYQKLGYCLEGPYMTKLLQDDQTGGNS